MSENARDTQFAGFARLLWDEVRHRYDFWLDTVELDLNEHIMALIARRAYDLALHVVGETIGAETIAHVPDMTALPSSQEGK